MAARLVAVLLVLLVGACGTTGGRGGGGAPPQGLVEGEVVVQAAASLTSAFTAMEAPFRAVHPTLDLTFNFAGSQTLASQILHGAPVDVFASAAPRQLQVVAEDGLLAGDPTTFARNGLAIAVAPGNPRGIADLADLDDPAVALVLAAPEVPAGLAAAEVLAAAGVDVTPVSLEPTVRSVLAKVVLGEADAGIVYSSDLSGLDAGSTAGAAGTSGGDRVEAVAIPTPANTAVDYPIAVLADAPNPDGAEAFVAFVTSAAGQAILTAHGFISAGPTEP